MSQKDYYAILDVSPGAELSIIEASYWRLARRYNATLATDPNVPGLLSDLNEAYEALTIPRLRGECDELLASVAVRGGVGHPPRRRLWRLWWPHARDEKEREAPERSMTATAPMEPRDLEAMGPESLPGSGAQSDTAAIRGAVEHQEGDRPKVAGRRPALVRWEMPPLQAVIASAGMAVLGGMALAAGADPELTVVLGGVPMFFCLIPWRLGRVLRARLPLANDLRHPDEAKRAADLRESTAAIVSRWRQAAGLLDPSGAPTAAAKPAPRSASRPPSRR